MPVKCRSKAGQMLVKLQPPASPGVRSKAGQTSAAPIVARNVLHPPLCPLGIPLTAAAAAVGRVRLLLLWLRLPVASLPIRKAGPGRRERMTSTKIQGEVNVAWLICHAKRRCAAMLKRGAPCDTRPSSPIERPTRSLSQNAFALTSQTRSRDGRFCYV